MCNNLYIFILISGKGITNCAMVAGELISESEQYLEITSTSHECQRRVKVREPMANGITWTHNDHKCWAKFNSSDSIMDPKGCSFCSSCFFSKSFHDYFKLFARRKTTRSLHVFDLIKCRFNVFVQFTVVGEKHSFLNAVKYVDQESNAKEKFVTILHLLEVICVLVMTLMDAWKM